MSEFRYDVWRIFRRAGQGDIRTKMDTFAQVEEALAYAEVVEVPDLEGDGWMEVRVEVTRG
jgi:hypothetical protein